MYLSRLPGVSLLFPFSVSLFWFLQLLLRSVGVFCKTILFDVFDLGPCLSSGTCFPGVSCLNVGVGQAKCGPCPKGYEGNGTTCHDIDEVSRGGDLAATYISAATID